MKPSSKIGSSLIVVLLLANAALAQKSVTPFAHYSYDVWRTKEGLPQNSVYAIIQSRDGYIWFGTQEGLVRFDGVQFVVFDKRNTPGLMSNSVFSLHEAGDSSIWIGTDGGGVTRMKGGEFTTFTARDGLPSNSVRSIVSDQEQTLWFGTSNGMARLKEGKITPFDGDEGSTFSWINKLLVDRQGMLWIGTNGGGLSRIVGGKSFASSIEDPLCGSVVMALHEDRSGGLWIGAEKGTLTHASGRARRTFTLAGVRGVVSAILQDQDGLVWIGTDDGVLAQFVEPDSLIYFSRSGSSVSSLFEDREGNLWVGRLGGGLSRLKKGKFTTYTMMDGLANDFVQVLCADRDGSVWIGSLGGLSRFSQNAFTSYTLQDGLPIEGMMALHAGRDGSLWIGTSDGLMRLKGGRFRTFISSSGTPQNSVRGIGEDGAGNLWLATQQGLLFSPSPSHGEPRFAPYGDGAGILREPLMCLHVTRRGDEMWLSTASSGLVRIMLKKSVDKITRFTMQDGLSANSIRSMYEDEDGTMWFGTFGRGLNRFKGGKFTVYTQENGLFDDKVFAILGDGNGNLWMSCNRGVFRVSKKDLDDFADGQVKTISFLSYGTADGMRTFECNGGSQPSGCTSMDGRLWFATLEGAAVIDPAHIEPNILPPPVVIEHAMIDRREVDPWHDATAAPGNGELEFTYTALSFVAPERVRFKYRLEGFDEEWIDADKRRMAYFTNIPPGKYTFRVIASNADGAWNETGASFTFSLAPHFYQTSWFYAVCVALIALFGSLGYHFYRSYKDRAQIASRLQAQLAQAELQVLKMQLQPHFLFNTLHAISSLMHKDLDAADEMMARLGEFLRYTLEKNGAQEVALAQELEMLDHYLEIEQIRLADRLTIRKGIADELRAAMVPNLILQPIVENAIRHAIAPRQAGGSLEISATQAGDRIRITVCDDGPGLSERTKEGVGFSNTRARLEQLYRSNYQFTYANKPEGGVCVTLEFPLRIESHEFNKSSSQPES